MGYGLGSAGGVGVQRRRPASAPIAVMGDGGFWHNGLTTGIGNAVFNKDDNVMIVVDNGYSAATGGQDILSSARRQSDRAAPSIRSRRRCAASASTGCGTLDRTYDVARMRDTLKEALTTAAKGPKVIVAQSECMLNKQRRIRPQISKAIKAGKRVVRERFGVDETSAPAIMPASGCPAARRCR